jgi:hypothetical protein
MHYDDQYSTLHYSEQCLADITPSSENSFCVPYITREANVSVKTSTTRMDTRRVKSGLNLFRPNFLLNPVAPKVDKHVDTA